MRGFFTLFLLSLRNAGRVPIDLAAVRAEYWFAKAVSSNGILDTAPLQYHWLCLDATVGAFGAGEV